MFNKYSKLKSELESIERDLNNKKLSYSHSHDTLENLKICQNKDMMERERRIEQEIDRILEEHKNNVEPEFEIYKKILERHKQEVFAQINLYKAKVNNYDFLDDTDYVKDLKEIQARTQKLQEKLSGRLTNELVKTYGKIFKITEISKKDMSKIYFWLDYFENYDSFDKVMQVSDSLVTKVKVFEDKSFFVCIIIIFILLAIKLKVFLAIIVLSYSFVTLFIRTKEFYYLARLASVAEYLSNLENSYKISRDIRIDDFKQNEDNKIFLLLDKSRKTFERIQRNIDKAIGNKKEDVIKNFNRSDFKELAERSIEDTSNATQQRIEEEQMRTDKLSDEIRALQEKYLEKKNEISDLKLEIKKTYEDLEPNFKSYQMIDGFFLGFDENDEPVTFNYDGKPTLIIYQSILANQYKALMDTIIMMCCQIMTAMSPLSYKINVVDTMTGGAALSSFQVTSDKEDNVDSELFQTVTTANDVQNLIKELYKEYNNRKVKILGSYNDITEYNNDKKSRNARTEYFIINIFYEYDYGLLASDEKLRQLCRIGKEVGILFIFAIDANKIESPDKTRDNESGKIYKYKPDLLEKIDLFDNHIYSFIIRDSVDIVPSSLLDIKKMIKTNI